MRLSLIAALLCLVGCGGINQVLREDTAKFTAAATEMATQSNGLIDRLSAASEAYAIEVRAADPECPSQGAPIGRLDIDKPKDATEACETLWNAYLDVAYPVVKSKAAGKATNSRPRKILLCIPSNDFEQLRPLAKNCDQLHPYYMLSLSMLDKQSQAQLQSSVDILTATVEYVVALNEFVGDNSEAAAKSVSESLGVLTSVLGIVTNLWKEVLPTDDAAVAKASDLLTTVTKMSMDADDAEAIRDLLLCRGKAQDEECLGRTFESQLSLLADAVDAVHRVALPAAIASSESLAQTTYDLRRRGMTPSQRRDALTDLAALRKAVDALTGPQQGKPLNEGIRALAKAHGELRRVATGDLTAAEKKRANRASILNFLKVADAFSSFF